MDRSILSQGHEWDLVIKVKYKDELRRLIAHVYGNLLDCSMSDLRMKITKLFKLQVDAELVLTYTDVDGDVAILDNDDELCDAAINQRLNPLRIHVQLNGSSVGISDEKSLENSYKSWNHPNKTNFGNDEVLTSNQGPLHRLSQDLISKAVESASLATDILGQFSKLGLSHSGSSAFRDFGTHENASSCKIEIKSGDTVECHGSTEPSKSSEKLESAANIPTQADTDDLANSWRSGPSLGSDLPFSSSCVTGKKKVDAKEENNRHNDVPIMPSTAISQTLMPATDQRQNFGGFETTATSNFSPGFPGANSDEANMRIPSFAHFSACCSSSSECGVAIEKHLSSPVCETSYRNSSKSHYYGSPRAFHRLTRCNGCGMLPIIGPRYKSIVKEDYDLCTICFSRMGNMNDYMRIDFPQYQIPSNSISCSSHGYRVQQHGGKLESRFIEDITIPDGTCMLPLTPFRKIWRIHNNGSIPWPVGTQLVWIAGEQLTPNKSIALEIPIEGIPVNEEFDIGVQFIAPAKHGRYISYWRMASPSGKKFGQRIWVLIEVNPSWSLGAKNPGMELNLNLPPESSIWGEPSINDDNDEPLKDVSSPNQILDMKDLECREGNDDRKSEMDVEKDELIGVLICESPGITEASNITHNAGDNFEPMKEPVAAISDSTCASAEESVSSTMSAVASEAADLSPLQSPPGMVSLNNAVEHDLLKELEDIGFGWVELNKEVLRQNNYDLDGTLDCLCAISDWKPLMNELNEMGFHDKMKNAKLLIMNKGSISEVVLDLLAEQEIDY